MSEPVVVFRTWSDIEASIVRGLLEAHGVEVSLASDVPHTVFPLSVNGLGEVRIAVASDVAETATRLIQDYRSSDESGPPARIRDEFETLQDAAGYRFRDRGILEHALTHRSRANEDVTGGVTDNESLEFLGDAVLGFVVAELLFVRFPERDEGQKSKMKAALVSTPALARQASRLGLGEHLLLGRGEEKTGGRRKRALLADGYEALIAAVFLDGGIDEARDFVMRQFADEIEEVRSPSFWERDYKSSLQERLQSRMLPLPEYLVTAESGPDHRKIFQVEVRVQGETLARASGRSKKEAEQQAARLAIEKLAAE